MNLKKCVIGITMFMLFFSISSIVVLAVAEKNNAFDMKKWGKKEYYVQIAENGKEETVQSENGEKFTRYGYTMKAYDERGKEVTVKFDAGKNLKLQAYLRVYVEGEYDDKTKSIYIYEEVTKNELPEKVKEKLGVK